LEESLSNRYPFSFHIPTQIVFRRGAIAELATLDSVVGKRCMLFTYDGFERRDVIDVIRRTASALQVVEEFEENPTDRLAKQIADRAKEFGAETLVAIGGGSSIDLAKAVAWFDANPKSDQHWQGEPQGVRMAIVAVPTTSGTGSEVSPFTVLTNAETHAKWFVKHTSIIPQTALCDPELTLSVPRLVTANTGIDALSHSIEGLLSKMCSGFLEPIALDSCRLVKEFLPIALQVPDDLDARESLLSASLEGGVILSTCGTVIVHALGYQLTQSFGYRHGEVNALMLAAFVDRLAALGSKRAQAVSDIFDGDLDGFIRDCGVTPDHHLSGLNGEQIDAWVDAGWNAYGRPNAVVELSRDDVRAVVTSAFA
jgi:alcohol dehydrogenase class IV